MKPFNLNVNENILKSMAFMIKYITKEKTRSEFVSYAFDKFIKDMNKIDTELMVGLFKNQEFLSRNIGVNIPSQNLRKCGEYGYTIEKKHGIKKPAKSSIIRASIHYYLYLHKLYNPFDERKLYINEENEDLLDDITLIKENFDFDAAKEAIDKTDFEELYEDEKEDKDTIEEDDTLYIEEHYNENWGTDEDYN